jgi:hypothetical protein
MPELKRPRTCPDHAVLVARLDFLRGEPARPAEPARVRERERESMERERDLTWPRRSATRATAAASPRARRRRWRDGRRSHLQAAEVCRIPGWMLSLKVRGTAQQHCSLASASPAGSTPSARRLGRGLCCPAAPAAHQPRHTRTTTRTGRPAESGHRHFPKPAPGVPSAAPSLPSSGPGHRIGGTAAGQFPAHDRGSSPISGPLCLGAAGRRALHTGARTRYSALARSQHSR